jgi:diguanylate cyclase (GGDEF)-like protein
MDRESVLRGFKFFENKNLSYVFDPLTRVLNRETIVGYIKDLIINNQPFSLFIADIDNFKYVNDTFGHMVGDQVLVQTANYLADKVGDSGVIGRFGGDEFMIVFEDVTEYKDVWQWGHFINSDTGSLKFEGVSGLHISVTMGVARYPLDALNYDGILKLADKALYRGKMKGRNCFIIYLAEKHKNIDLKAEKDKSYSSMYLCSNVFTLLTESQDLQSNVTNLFKWLVSYFMFDHICLESQSGMIMEVMHRLTKVRQFKHINYDVISRAVNSQGIINISRIETVDDTCGVEFANALKEQNVTSTLYCKVQAFGKDYGFIRVDMTDTVRIWQAGEMDIIVVAANAIAMILYYQGKTLEDFAPAAPFFLGEQN